MKLADLEDKAIETLRHIFAEISFAELVEEIEPPLDNREHSSWRLRLRLPGQDIRLLIEMKSSGEPRIARAVVNQILRLQDSAQGSYGVFVAPWISPTAAQICREAQIGYVDLAGNCRLTFDGVHIEREGKPNSFAEKRELRSLYSPKAARVIRVLLCDPRRPWKLQALADEAQVSLGQVHKVKCVLADQEWLRAEANGIVLSDPAELLAQWARTCSRQKKKANHFYTLETPEKLEEDLATACSRSGIRYALAAFSAAARYAPFVRYQRVFAYVEEGRVAELAQSLHLKEAPTGANLIIWVPDDEGLWYGAKTHPGVTVTSSIQTYLDLQSLHERGDEAARFLLEHEIKPRW